jgi:hypothetical protein
MRRDVAARSPPPPPRARTDCDFREGGTSTPPLSPAAPRAPGDAREGHGATGLGGAHVCGGLSRAGLT